MVGIVTTLSGATSTGGLPQQGDSLNRGTPSTGGLPQQGDSLNRGTPSTGGHGKGVNQLSI